MRKIQRGDKVKVKHRHNNLPAGAQGVVTGTFNGPYAQVSYPGFGGGPFYCPMPHIDGDDSGTEPDTDDSGASGGSSPVGSTPTAAALESETRRGAWEKLMGHLRSQA